MPSGATDPNPLSIGRLILRADAAPKIAASVQSIPTARALAGYKKRGLDIVEIRLDLFAAVPSPESAAKIAAACAKVLPTIVTARIRGEGGKWRGGEQARAAILRAALVRADAVDVELGASIAPLICKAAKAANKTLILSAHHFQNTPTLAEMRRARRAAFARGADIFKIAAALRDQSALRRLAQFALDDSGAVVAVGMGRFGAASRCVLPFLGARFTFAHLGKPTATGQMTLDDAAAVFAKLRAK